MYWKVVCAWCGKHIRTERINVKDRGTILSQGMCKSCKSNAFKEVNDYANKDDISESQGAGRAYGS